MHTSQGMTRAAAFSALLHKRAGLVPTSTDGKRLIDSMHPAMPVHQYGPVREGDVYDDDSRTLDLSCVDHRADEHEIAWAVIASMCFRMDAALPHGPFPDFTVKDRWALEGVDTDDAERIAELDIDYRVIGMESISPFPQTFVLRDGTEEIDRFPGAGMTFAAIRERLSAKASERLGGKGLWRLGYHLQTWFVNLELVRGHVPD